MNFGRFVIGRVSQDKNIKWIEGLVRIRDCKLVEWPAQRITL